MQYRQLYISSKLIKKIIELLFVVLFFFNILEDFIVFFFLYCSSTYIGMEKASADCSNSARCCGGGHRKQWTNNENEYIYIYDYSMCLYLYFKALKFQWGLFRAADSKVTPDSPGLLKLRSSSLKWQDSDSRAKARNSQPFSVIWQPDSLQSQISSSASPLSIFQLLKEGKRYDLPPVEWSSHTNLRTSSLQLGLFSPVDNNMAPVSWMSLSLKSSSTRLELLDLRTEIRASQLFHVNLQLLKLERQHHYTTAKVP